MKPTMKKNVQNTNQNDSVEKKTAKTIVNYFASTPKPFVIEKIGDPASSKTYYLQALNEILESKVRDTEAKEVDTGAKVVDTEATANPVEDDGACAFVLDDQAKDKFGCCVQCIEKDKLLENWEAKYKSLQKVYLNQSHHFSELTIKHNVLLMTSNHSQPDDNANACKDDIFSPTELKILKNMSLDKKKDSTFIHQCLEYVYKNDLSLLSSRTLKGKPESVKFSDDGQEIRVPKKDPLSPEKVDRIKELFIERIVKCRIDSASFETRIKDSNINKIFASCINNIANKHI